MNAEKEETKLKYN